ncbi:hypothetical protein OH77DRAFT_25819 [Trametes cingulata]|nr:hypothetical protein OH77DRAFT_25819 [Trametes cingulata]
MACAAAWSYALRVYGQGSCTVMSHSPLSGVPVSWLHARRSSGVPALEPHARLHPTPAVGSPVMACSLKSHKDSKCHEAGCESDAPSLIFWQRAYSREQSKGRPRGSDSKQT